MSKNSLSSFILLTLEKTIDGYLRFEDFANHHYRYHYDVPEIKKSSLAQALKRLREAGLVDFLSEKELVIRLTDKGKDKALWTKMRLEKEDWDGKWRLVIWDIPEKRKEVREMLRFKLKQLGFKKIQNSVWGSKIDCTIQLRKFIKSVGIERWVMVLESDNIEI